jgi:hypothetical protein
MKISNNVELIELNQDVKNNMYEIQKQVVKQWLAHIFARRLIKSLNHNMN